MGFNIMKKENACFMGYNVKTAQICVNNYK